MGKERVPVNPVGAASGDAVLRAPESHHAVESDERVQSHHARGARAVNRRWC